MASLEDKIAAMVSELNSNPDLLAIFSDEANETQMRQELNSRGWTDEEIDELGRNSAMLEGIGLDAAVFRWF